MKSIKYFAYILAFILISACEQEVIVLQAPPAPPVDTSCEDAVPGSAVFTKFVAVGNSFVAGFQAGALFTEGQNNSLPAILNKQFECVGAPAAFVQPTINTPHGFNIFITPNPTTTGVILEGYYYKEPHQNQLPRFPASALYLILQLTLPSFIPEGKQR